MMDAAVQVTIVAGDKSIKANDKKKTESPNSQDFKKHLEKYENAMQKTSDKNKLQEKEENYSMQLLNLFYMLTMGRSNVPTEELQLANKDVNTLNDMLDIMISKEELSNLWEKIVSEFKTNGFVKSETVNQLYKAMRTEVPNIRHIDINVFREQIIQILQGERESEYEHTTDSMVQKNIVFLENHDDDNIKWLTGTSLSESNNLHTKNSDLTKTKPRVEIQLNNSKGQGIISNSNRENLLFNNGPPDETTVLINNENSQHNVNIPFYKNESSGFSSNLLVNDKNLYSLENRQPVNYLDQIVDKAFMAIKGDIQEVNIRLKPDYLGDVLIKIHADTSNLKAEFFVENNQVRNMLQVHAQDVQNHIMQQGYNISEISIYELSEGLEMGAFDHQFNSHENYNQSRKSRFSIGEQSNDNQEITVSNYYDKWANVSRVNYMI